MSNRIKEQMLKEIGQSNAEFVTYANDGIPVARENALIDIASMDDNQFEEENGIGGWWSPCDIRGNILS